MDSTGTFIRVVYNLRVHEDSKEPIIGIITCFSVPMAVIQANQMLYNNYKRLMDKLNESSEVFIRNFYGDDYLRRDDEMLYRRRNSDKLIDLTKEELFAMSIDELALLESDRGSCDASYWLVKASTRFDDPWKLDPYYAKTDTVNDPTGFLHEDYTDIHSFEPINEQNLLQYNHKNVKIYNELLELKYQELGGRQNLTNEYVDNEWPEGGPAMFAVAYGYDQPIVYKNLCDAFGKENTDHVWQKYYKSQ